MRGPANCSTILTLCRLGRHCGARAGILLSFARCDQAEKQLARGRFVGGRERVERTFRRHPDRLAHAARPRIGAGSHRAAFALIPGLLQRVLQQGQHALVLARLVENALDQIRRIECESQATGRLRDRGFQLVARHRPEQDLPRRQERFYLRVTHERIVEVGADRADHRHRTSARRRQQEVDETTDVDGVLAGLLLVTGARRLGIELLPLVDIEQQPLGPTFRPLQFAEDHVRQELRVTGSKSLRFVADFFLVFGDSLALRTRIEGSRQRAQWVASGRERQHAPELVARLPQGGQQSGIDQGRLSAARPAHHENEWVLADLADQLVDSAAPAEEECRVLLAERIEAAVGTDRFLYGAFGLAADRREQSRQRVRRLGHVRGLGKVDPGQQMEKVERPVGRRSRQHHRDDRERRIAGLPDQRELSLVLLRVAEPRAEQHDHRLGGIHRPFERRDPRQARCELTAVDERDQAVGTQE